MMNKRRAITAIEKAKVLLVYPIKNRPDIPSLWSAFCPKKEMVWEWTEDGDVAVAELWHLREQLSRSGDVVYLKWFRNRATFFSPDMFVELLAYALSPSVARIPVPAEARQILETLELDSPLSTKELKRSCDLRGQAHEAAFQRALRALWSRFLIVGYGEVDDGAFPSLAIGSTRLLFEDLWRQAEKKKTRVDGNEIFKRLPPAFAPEFAKLVKMTLEDPPQKAARGGTLSFDSLVRK